MVSPQSGVIKSEFVCCLSDPCKASTFCLHSSRCIQLGVWILNQTRKYIQGLLAITLLLGTVERYNELVDLKKNVEGE